MQINELVQLVESVSKSEVQQFIYKTNSEFLSINKTVMSQMDEKKMISVDTANQSQATQPLINEYITPQAGQAQPIQVMEEKPHIPAEQNKKLVDVPAPFVGTVIFNNSKTGDRFVELEDKVTKGQLIFIMESMKLFTDVLAPVSGKVAQICVGNNQLVEFGEVILRIDEG
jgi:biotin carboxyl carrier protein